MLKNDIFDLSFFFLPPAGNVWTTSRNIELCCIVYVCTNRKYSNVNSKKLWQRYVVKTLENTIGVVSLKQTEMTTKRKTRYDYFENNLALGT